MVNFIKMHGNSNDFVIIDMRLKTSELDIKLLADRKLGIGCDQLVTLHPSTTSDCALKIYNKDGSSATMCGNAVRCVAALLFCEKNIIKCTLNIGDTLLKCWKLENGLIKVELKPPKFLHLSPHLTKLLKSSNYYCWELIDVGNIHLILFPKFFNSQEINNIGPYFEISVMPPTKVNVSIAQIIASEILYIETWEKGTGYTASCGSAACAAAVTAINNNLVLGDAIQVFSGGGKLLIKWAQLIYMTGEAKTVYQGYLL